MRDRDAIDPPPNEPPDPFIVELGFVEPARNQVLTGPYNGVTVRVRGTATIASGTGTIGKVEVVMNGRARPATSTGAAWSTWEATETYTTAGATTITAKAFDGAGKLLVERTLSIVTALQPRPADPPPTPPTDTTPPTIAILAPKAPEGGFSLDGTGKLTFTVSGTASDPGSGVEKVEVTLDGAPVAVTRSSNGLSWSSTNPVTITTAGKHTIVVTATDKSPAKLSASQRLDLDVLPEPITPPYAERLMIVERCRLSTYAGAYGPGNMVKTLSLLPGEKTTIAVKSFRRTSETSSDSSSILDTTTTKSQEEFAKTLESEQASKRNFADAKSWNVEASASATWGFGSASVKAGATGSSNAAREELAKSVANAVNKHAAEASSKRDIEIKSSREMKKEEGEEFSSESHIENINVSRTLNFVFRQMNQQYLTVLHLVDVRIAYVRGDLREKEDGTEVVDWRYQEVSLSQLDGLLRQVVVEARREDVRREIIRVLSNVFDHGDERHTMVEEQLLEDGAGNPAGSYLRVPKGKISTYEDPATGWTVKVPGVILATTQNVMRTDGILCDALLGQGEALDGYSRGLQDQTVETRRLDNRGRLAEIARDELAVRLVDAGDAAKAELYGTVFPAPESESLALVTSPPSGNGGSAH